MSTLAEFRATEARRAAEQVRINEVFASAGRQVADAAIRMSATLAVAEFPQYHGKFGSADWTLGQCTQDVETKGGLRAAKGDIVLMRYEPGLGMTAGRKSIWSVRGQIECVIDYGVEPLDGWAAFFRASR